MLKALRIAMFSGAAVLGSLVSAHAGTLTPLELLQQFNLIVTGNVTGSSGGHIHGRALVGGDFSGVSEVYSHGDGATSDFAALTVAGSVTGTSKVKVLSGGDAVVGGGADKLEMGGGSISAFGPDSAPESYGRILSDYAQDLSRMEVSAAGVTANMQGAQVRGYTIADVANAVISLTEADIYRENFTFDLGSGVDWVLVNVFATDTDKSFDPGSAFKLQQGGATAQKLIWNFVGFDDVTFDARFSVAALLADGATVKTTSGDIEGSVFAKDFVAGSQLHYIGVSSLPPGAPLAPIPLPAAGLLLLAGLGGLGVVARRRRAA